MLLFLLYAREKNCCYESKCSFMFALWIAFSERKAIVDDVKRIFILFLPLSFSSSLRYTHAHCHKRWRLFAESSPKSFELYRNTNLCGFFYLLNFNEAALIFALALYIPLHDVLTSFRTQNMFTLDVVFGCSSKSFFNTCVIDVNERSLQIVSKCREPMFVSVILLLFKALSIPEITSSINEKSNNNNNHSCTPALLFDVPAVYVSEKRCADGPFVLETQMCRHDSASCMSLSLSVSYSRQWVNKRKMDAFDRSICLALRDK